MYEVRWPELPYTDSIRKLVEEHAKFEVSGHVMLDENDGNNFFAIELLSYPNIVLQLKFQFTGHPVIVLKSRDAYDGSQTKKYACNPLKNKDLFELVIHVHGTHYEITLNGKKLTTFEHRLPYDSVESIGVYGNAFVNKINFENPQHARQPGVRYCQLTPTIELIKNIHNKARKKHPKI